MWVKVKNYRFFSSIYSASCRYFFFDFIQGVTEKFPSLFKKPPEGDEDAITPDYLRGESEATLEGFGWLPVVWIFSNEEVAKVDATFKTNYMTFLTLANYVTEKAKQDAINRAKK